MTKRERPQSINKQGLEEEKKKTVKLMDILKPPKQGNFKGYDSTKQTALPRQFFRQDVVTLSKDLLGKVFIRNTENGVIKAIIVETQAYKAPLDKGCHAYGNKKTEKTKYFWLDGGSLYIYTIYMVTNICLNVVAALQGEPQAVLIRAVQPIQGIQLVKNIRKIKSNKLEDLSNGPGKVGQALAVDKATMNGMDLLDGDFKIVDAGIKNFEMGVSRRVNIDYAQEWIDKPWRFFVEGNSFVSKVDLQAPPKKKTKKKNQKKKKQESEHEEQDQ